MSTAAAVVAASVISCVAGKHGRQNCLLLSFTRQAMQCTAVGVCQLFQVFQHDRPWRHSMPLPGLALGPGRGLHRNAQHTDSQGTRQAAGGEKAATTAQQQIKKQTAAVSEAAASSPASARRLLASHLAEGGGPQAHTCDLCTCITAAVRGRRNSCSFLLSTATAAVGGCLPGWRACPCTVNVAGQLRRLPSC